MTSTSPPAALRVGIVGSHYELDLRERELALLVAQGRIPYEEQVEPDENGDRRQVRR